ncbi:putative enterotoxin [Ophiocordyceps australis]|uniref:Putative enterotoxin n=1 Tax=Ophiocordyceps australis TaxID=1399860 RepID=A0A2C5XL54_9HYPO|nr:putative enterotoxin [Ophiocordyceps australis]
MALEFADEFERGPNYVWFGYLYKIAADWKMIDLEDSLKHRYRGAHRKEQSAVIGIPFEQIIGWYDLRKVGPEWGKNTASVTERLKKGETLDGFVNNEHFDPRYLKTRGAGGKPQLAGFHPDDDLWNSEPWNKFPGHSAPEALKKYIQENYDPEIDDERIWKWAVEPQSQEADRMANMEAQVANKAAKTPKLMGAAFYGPGTSTLQIAAPRRELAETQPMMEAKKPQPPPDTGRKMKMSNDKQSQQDKKHSQSKAKQRAKHGQSTIKRSHWKSQLFTWLKKQS